ncbi:MFS transporter [Candidatus Bathyarchaeota archaeon]|nr:MFS transporter [Candidatus Bathyarchaeota archaeon]
MSRNLIAIAVILAIIGFYTGAFGLLFTLYLDYLRISLPTMGAMISVSGLIGFLVTVFIGVHADVWRRKTLCSVAMLLNSISSFLIYFLRGVWELTAVKIVDDIGLRLRATVQNALIFEHFRSSYAKIFARIQGIELILSGLGFFATSPLILILGFQGSFIFISLLLFCAFLIFQLLVDEPARPMVSRRSVLETYRFDISRELKILCAFSLLFNLGFAICHSVFIFTLFFLKKFAIDSSALSIILGIHHFTFGLPMLLVSKLYARKNVNYKMMFMIGNTFIGLPHVLAAFAPNLITAAAVWFLHDIIGASISTPAQQTLMQIYARDDQRAKDINMVSLFGTIGVIVGPAIGGFLAGININLPFIIGGTIITAATITLAPLKY